jgi:hypothetical protein
MAFPFLTTWVEEIDAASRERIACMRLNALESIAKAASQPKVLFVVGSAESFRVNVLHFEQAENIFLEADAIATAVPRLGANTALHIFVNLAHGFNEIVTA